MGMYTGFRFKGLIKEEYRNDIEIMLEDGEWNNCEHEILKEYSKVNRSSFIPFGSLAYMPDCWEGEPYYEDQPWNCKATNGFERYFNKETGLLCFSM